MNRNRTEVYHFHEYHGHDTNQCRELRHQIEEAVKSGQLAHRVKEIKKGKAKVSDTQLEWKKGDKDTTPVEATILMIYKGGHTSKIKSTEEPINGIGEITCPPVSGDNNSSDLVIIKAQIFRRQVNRVYMDSGSLCEATVLFTRTEVLNFVIVRSDSPHNLLLGRTSMQRMGIVVSTIHRAIKFHTLRGVGTVFSTYEPDKTGEGQKKLKEAPLKVTKVPTSFKKKLRDLLKLNADIFAWTHTYKTGILRTVMVGGKHFNTEHKLDEYKHIEPVKQKKRGMASKRNEAICKEVEELTKANILREVKYQTWVSNPVMQVPTSFKKKLRDLLKSNADIFAWTHTYKTRIPRTVMVGGKHFNTEHKLDEYKHIEPVKQKKRGMASERNEAICKEVEELTKANILREVKYQTWVSNPVMVKKDDDGNHV
ncbi:hypothetical protein Tco_0010639 [Tanacetum coccineum]